MRIRWLRWSAGKCFIIACAALISLILLIIQWRSHSSVLHGNVVKDVGPLDSEENVLKMSESEIDNKIIPALHNEIESLRNQLDNKINLLSQVKMMTKDEKKSVLLSSERTAGKNILQYLQSQIEKAYVLHPYQYRNEYAIPPFSSFTRKSVLRLELGLIKQPEIILPVYEDLQADLLEVIEKGTRVVNNPEMDFVEGFYRIQYQVGTQYELVFSSTVNTSTPMYLVTLFRPFAPLQAIATNLQDSTEIIHIIVPLRGRGDSFRRFMDNFETEAITGDGHIYLTVVCYGTEALTDATEIMSEIEKKLNFNSYQVVEGHQGEFSRGRALQEGTTKLPGNNPLMFFCDVDMFFTSHFLSQCRLQTKPGSKVFYPIVFSLYNPEIVYKGKPIPPLKEQQVVKRDNGFWRDFGFGMTCQYKGDFNDIGGFDLTIKGWGSEDVLLYRKYTRSMKYQVVRNPVDSLFHHWHPKHCDKSLSLEQYNACLRTRSLTEGSQIQLGMLYLEDKDETT